MSHLVNKMMAVGLIAGCTVTHSRLTIRQPAATAQSQPTTAAMKFEGPCWNTLARARMNGYDIIGCEETQAVDTGRTITWIAGALLVIVGTYAFLSPSGR
jgi:hypothetical protein